GASWHGPYDHARPSFRIAHSVSRTCSTPCKAILDLLESLVIAVHRSKAHSDIVTPYPGTILCSERGRWKLLIKKYLQAFECIGVVHGCRFTAAQFPALEE